MVIKMNIQDYERLSDKHLEMFIIMYYWVRNLHNKKRISDYLKDRGYMHIAIYGSGYMGKCLCEELLNEGIGVDYFIDKNVKGQVMDIPVEQDISNLKPVDAVIVTPVYFFYEIEKELKENIEYPILSLGDIIYKL